MPSPFPGMDPYLESPLHWPGVHSILNVAIASELNRTLPTGFVANVELYVSQADKDELRQLQRLHRPDVSILQSSRASRVVPHESGMMALLANPTVVSRFKLVKPRKRSFVLIMTRESRRVLTALELLSPSNKHPGKDRDMLLAKRENCITSGTNFVEIDLLRCGKRLPYGKPKPPHADYACAVFDMESPDTAAIWAFGVRNAIPSIPIPVQADVEPVMIDLRRCIDRCYDDGRYRDQLDYSKPPDPPMNEADRLWVEQLLSRRIPT